ncbi:MAG: glycosyltransferase [Lachnospiraceae bacterium]|nr:glycosyltransferase [Lachnospiraceae bacterium]
MRLLDEFSDKFSRQNRRRFRSYLKRNGVRSTYYKVIERLKRDKAESNYSSQYIKSRPDENELTRQRLVEFPMKYKISIIVPAYETDPSFLKQMLSSVIRQTYTEWELCIADGSKTDTVQNVVMETIGSCKDERIGRKIKYQRLRENKGISGNANAAITMATGDYIGFLDHDDVLTVDALFEVVSALNNSAYRRGNVTRNHTLLLYSDEDKVNEDMTRYFDFHGKPDFDIDLLRSNNYICHFLVVAADIIQKTGGFLREYDGAQDHDLILRCIELMEPRNIRHIPKVLYHWRAHDISTATNPDSKLYAYEAGKRAIEDHLRRQKLSGKVLYTEHLGFFRVKYDPGKLKCIEMTGDELSMYNEEMLRALPADAIMIKDAKLEALNKDYLEELLGNMIRDEVGAVGGKILYKDGRIDNAGFVFDENRRLKPRFRGMNGNYSGYMHRASIQNQVNSLDRSCMMVKKQALLDSLSESTEAERKYVSVYDPFAKFRRR